MKSKTITKIFILSGLVNLISVPIFTSFFTSDSIPNADPQVMSFFGLVMIMIWGLAFIAVARNYAAVRWIVGVFALEKLAYGIVWAQWMLNNDVSAVYEQDALAGIFYSIYGVNDWMFFVFFSYVFIRLFLKENKIS